MKNYIYTLLILVLLIFTGCEDYIEVEIPDHIITREVVFDTDESARSAMNGIYNELFNNSFSNGRSQSVTYLSGLSGDNLSVTTNSFELMQFVEHNLASDNSNNLILWSGAYNLIYMVNSLLEGIENSSSLSEEVTSTLEGEAKFIRAFTYFYLTNLYGEVPLLLSTDYNVNALESRYPVDVVHAHIIRDLMEALDLLAEEYPGGDRTRVNKYVVMSLLARVYLYAEDWEQAEYYSSQVISQTSLYDLIPLENVFLADSQEAIWQISPIGWGSSFTHTREGNLFIPVYRVGSVVLSEDFMNIWNDEQDLRQSHWIGEFSDNTSTYHFPYKYKIQYDASGGEIVEYSMVMRLAEQFLIRAEARAMQNDFAGAISDLDAIKGRAGIDLVADTYPTISKEEFLEEIAAERRKELFIEWGHRWLDLKRTGEASTVFGGQTDWQETDLLYPIPADEREKNPNLGQNLGY